MAILSKISSSFLRTLQVLGTLYMIGVMTYFTVKLSEGRGNRPDGKALAIEIISGAAILYASMMFILAFCLLQKTFFAFFTAIMDMLFMGAFIAIAILLRSAPGQNCSSGKTTTPNPQWLGRISGSDSIHCKLIVGLFGAAVGLAVLFFLTGIIALIASRSKKTQYDEEPRRSRREKHRDALPVRTAPAAAVPVINRQSVDTDFTKDTEKGSDVGVGREYHHTPARNIVAPAVVGTAGLAAAHHHHEQNTRSVSPLPSEYETTNVASGNNNYLSTVPITTRNLSHNSQNYEDGYVSNNATGIHTDTYTDRYNATELPSAVTPDIYDQRSGYQNNSATGTRLPNSMYNTASEPVDHNVGGVTGQIFQQHITSTRN